MDPKYTGTLHHTEGNYDLPQDEPIMVLRAKDPLTLFAINAYIYATQEAKDDHFTSALERYKAFAQFQHDHPHRVGVKCSEPRK